jgi:DNA-directed RNA polymerase subunit RPC12/RpoP
MDMAGNIGPWSDVFRLDIAPTIFSARSMGDGFITLDEGMEISIHDEIGIDIASLELTVRGTDGRAVHPEFGAEVEVRDQVPSSGAVQHPVSVLLSMSSAGVTGELALEVRWESVLPLGERRYAAFKGPVVDAVPPLIEVPVPEAVGSNPFPIRMRARDDASGLDLGSMAVEVGKGNRSGCNGPGEPRLERGEGDELVLHVNLTWGVNTPVSITVPDFAGNEAYAEVIVRASRRPEVWITSDLPLDGDLRIGQEVQLKASVFDPDQEALSFLWTVNGSAAGNGTVRDLVLVSSFINVTVTVSDGCLSGMDFVVLTAFYPNGRVEATFPVLPVLIGSGALLMIVIVATAVSVMTLTSYRKARSKGEGVEDHGRDTKVRNDRPEKGRKSKVYSGPGSSKGGGGEAGCSICMKTFQARSDNPRCRCGALFHKACALRKGVCPDCGREIMLKAE